MAPASTGVHVVEGAPQNGFCQCLRLQGELQLLPASLGDSLRSECRSDPGSFQMTASALGPNACEVLCEPVKSGVSISHRPLALLNVKASLAFKALHTPEGLSSWCRTPELGSPVWSLDPLLPGENLCNCD